MKRGRDAGAARAADGPPEGGRGDGGGAAGGGGVAKTTRENPDFVRSYFGASRLHFIGSFRARYEAMIAAVAARLRRPVAALLQPPHPPTRARRGARAAERIVVHVDMDCFFASVAMRDNPRLRGKPVAVCHGGMSDGSKGGEVSSCSYEARAHGVRAGMFVGRARALCPHLLAVPYDFDAYEQVSVVIYSLFYAIGDRVTVQATSVDEAYLDLTDVVKGSGAGSPDGIDELVQKLRKDIWDQTGCPASAGIGPSKLVARLATARAKPNGQYRVLQRDVSEFVSAVALSSLPGIGWSTSRKLEEMNIKSCEELRAMSCSALQDAFGDKLGRSFYDTCRGIDTEIVEPLKPRRSIGAEISWGVRFQEGDDDKVRDFLASLAREVAFRCTSVSAIGKKVSLKLYKKKKNSSLPYKILGHGPCDIISKSGRIHGQGRDDFASALITACHNLYYSVGLNNADFRGVALQVSDITFLSLKDPTAKPAPGSIKSFFGAPHSHPANGEHSENVALSQRGTAAQTDQQCARINDDDGSRTAKRPRGTAGDEILPAVPANAESLSLPLRGIECIDSDVVDVAKRNGWDPSVLAALPDAIREEVLADFRSGRARSFVGETNDAFARDLGSGNATSNPHRQVENPIDPTVEVDDDDDDDESSTDRTRLDGVTDVEESRRGTAFAAGKVPPIISKGIVDEAPSSLNAEGCALEQTANPIIRERRPENRIVDSRKTAGKQRGTHDFNDHLPSTPVEPPRNPLQSSNSFQDEAESSSSDEEGNWSIPSGWDASVFRALPLPIREELMRQERTDRAERRRRKRAQMRARRKQTTLTQMANRKPKTRLDTLTKQRPNPDYEECSAHPEGGRDASDLDVPSPPPLQEENRTPKDDMQPRTRWSGLPGGVLSQLEMQDAMQNGDGRVYKEESLASYAGKLESWIRATSGVVRSAHAELLRSRVLEMIDRRELSRAHAEMRTLRRFIEDVGGDWIDAFNAVLEDVQRHVIAILNVPLLIRPLKRAPRAGAL